MEDFSRLNGPAHISPVSGRLWGVLKKRKYEERKREERKKYQKGKAEKEEDPEAKKNTNKKEGNGASQDQDFEGEVGYSSSGVKKKISRKIDLVI